jgi:predicted  nucleic acid-binding Zn-ribbon protein
MSEDLKTEIELVKRDINQLNLVMGKLDITIDKLSEVATSINRMLAVQENRIDTQDRQLDKNVEIIHDRIEKHRSETSDGIEKSHRLIMDEIKKLREEQQTHHILVSERLTKLEQWRWIMIGGAMVVGYLISAMPIMKLFG